MNKYRIKIMLDCGTIFEEMHEGIGWPKSLMINGDHVTTYGGVSGTIIGIERVF